ncbi:hypothetical protein [Kurthia massiliensis]|uniref:hypothetical protein n=1 Tax=Kurthia massiliensis TaxID=1033739 RepID=UPI0002897078|nr:hypothetical protein [Kurthia massiliensis]
MHYMNVIDFAWNGQTLFIEFNGYDAEKDTRFNGMVRVVSGTPYGDMIHPSRSSLSEACRQYVVETLEARIARGDFD